MKVTIKLFCFFILTCFAACLETDQLEPDPCAEVECYNQFFCIDGNCVCPSGYKVYKGNCIQIDADDYVLSDREGGPRCFLDYHVLMKLPQPIGSLGYEDWSTI